MAVTRTLGQLALVALEDGAGPFFRPREEVFGQTAAAHWDSADALDPAAAGPAGEWLLRFRCFAVRPDSGAGTVLVKTITEKIRNRGDRVRHRRARRAHLSRRRAAHRPDRALDAGYAAEDLRATLISGLHLHDRTLRSVLHPHDSQAVPGPATGKYHQPCPWLFCCDQLASTGMITESRGAPTAAGFQRLWEMADVGDPHAADFVHLVEQAMERDRNAGPDQP